MRAPRWPEAARLVANMIAAGELRPGDVAPSAASLAKITGAHWRTCDKALKRLVKEGVLDPPRALYGRLRVPGGERPAPPDLGLAAALVTARRAAGLTQAQLAAASGLSVTTIACAEAARTRLRPGSWARLDAAAGAAGALVIGHNRWALASAESPQVR